MKEPEGGGQHARHGNGGYWGPMHREVADEGKFVLGDMIVDPVIDGIVKDAGIQGQEDMGERVAPVLEEKKEGEQQQKQGQAFPLEETFRSFVFRFPWVQERPF